MNTASSKRKHLTKSKTTKQRLKTKSSKSDVADTRDVFVKAKVRQLNNALDADPVDIDLLRRLMISNEGCITNDLRCKVWPKLLNINIFDVPRKKKADVELKEFQENRWWHQVNLDVNRSHRRFPFETRLSRKRVLQQQLMSIIMRVLCKNPELNYYQGYHDIAVTLLRVLGEDLATAVLNQLSNTLIRDFMDKNMNRTNKMLSFFYAVVGKVDDELKNFLLKSDVGTIFSLSWLITWYGHDLNGFDLIVRLCDVFLATHPVMPIYVAVALVLTHKQQVLERECDMAIVHHCLCRLPSYIGVDEIEDLITKAYELYQNHPPKTLKAEVRKYIKESDSISQHAQLLYRSYNQRPDSVLRRRKKHARLFPETSRQDKGTMTNEEIEEIDLKEKLKRKNKILTSVTKDKEKKELIISEQQEDIRQLKATLKKIDNVECNLKKINEVKEVDEDYFRETIERQGEKIKKLEHIVKKLYLGNEKLSKELLELKTVPTKVSKTTIGPESISDKKHNSFKSNTPTLFPTYDFIEENAEECWD